MTVRSRIVALVALTLALQYTHVAYGQKLDDIDKVSVELGEPWHGPASAHTVDEAIAARDRWRRAEAEQITEPSSSWAGRYVASLGLSGTAHFVWAPENGFAAARVGCDRNVEVTNYGRVAVSADRIRLEPEISRSPRGGRRLAAELVFVRWGERRYLVSREEVAFFCRYAAGLAPPSEHGIPFLMHLDDAKRPAEELPVVPKQFADMVVAPVDAEVVSVLSARPWPLASSVSLMTRVLIDAGAVDGLVVGSTLRIVGDGCYEEFVVPQVMRDSCEAEIFWPLDLDNTPHVVCDDGTTLPEVVAGMRVTSRRER